MDMDCGGQDVSLMQRKLSSMGSVQHGFTIVELTVVLAVIGLILSGIAVGRDLIREAQARRVHQFVVDWKRAYDIHYQRTGVVVGDNQIAPTYMVSGHEVLFNSRSRYGRAAGIPENYTRTGLRLCHGQGYELDRVGGGDRAEQSEQSLLHIMERAGINLPSGRAEGQEDRFLYQDTSGNPVELQICFQWNPEGTISGSGNVMVVRGLTPDMARRLDQMIDGQADALKGQFREQIQEQDRGMALASSTPREPGQEWSVSYASSHDDGFLPTSLFGFGERRTQDEEGRLLLMTAHWQMDQ